VIKMHQASCMNALGLTEDCLKCQISPLVNGRQTQTKPYTCTVKSIVL